jgi:hypothetical protein
MTDLASTNVTVTVNSADRDVLGGGGFKNLTIATIAFGNGTLTYPTGGVPLPDKAQFGFRNAIDFVSIQQPSANGFIYKYDATDHKIKIFTQGFTTGATGAASNENGALATDSAGAEAAAPRMPKTAPSTVYDMGALIELPAGIAPAAVTLKLLMAGL